MSAFFCVATPAPDYWDRSFGGTGIADRDGQVRAAVTWRDRLIIGGYFSQVGGVNATNIAIWDGNRWSSLGNGLGVFDANRSVASAINSVRVIDDEIYAAGIFTNSGAASISNIAKWNGAQWVPLGLGLSDPLAVIAVYDIAGRRANDLYAGGTFTTADGVPTSRIAHWNGQKWSPLGAGVSQSNGYAFVHTITINRDDVYLGGSFTSAGGVAATNIAKWTGSKWESIGNGLPGQAVYALAIVRGSLFAGGRFGDFAGGVLQGIAPWDGAAWISVGGPANGFSGYPGSVLSIASVQDRLFVGGEFSSIAGVAATNIAHWTGREWLPLGGGLRYPSIVYALASNGSEIFAGGSFDFAGDTSSRKIARWHIPRTLKVQSSQNQIHVSWPAPDTNFVLESTSSLNSNWQPVSQPPLVQDNRWTITNTISGTKQFFRLKANN